MIMPAEVYISIFVWKLMNVKWTFVEKAQTTTWSDGKSKG